MSNLNPIEVANLLILNCKEEVEPYFVLAISVILHKVSMNCQQEKPPLKMLLNH